MPDTVPFYHRGYSQSATGSTDFWIKKICKSPKSIYDHLNKYVYGHDSYKRALSMLIYKAYNHKRPKGALMVVGSSGTGKTEMLRVISTFYNNMTILDASLMTSQAYRGNNKITTGLRQLNTNTQGPLSICCIDEFDKMVMKSDDSSPLYELLKIIEGGTVDVTSNSNESPEIIDTSNICFILLGSFTYLSEQKKHMQIGFARSDEARSAPDLDQSKVLEQLPPEIRGRIENTVFLDTFSESDFLSIIQDERYSPVKRIGKELGINLSLSDEKAAQIAHKAYSQNNLGIRAINSEISNYVNNILFYNPTVKEISME